MYEVSLKYLLWLSREDTKIHCKLSKGNNSKNTQSRVIVLVCAMSSECALQRYEFWLKYLGYQVIERTRNSIANDQREISPKISKAEFWFLCMICRLNVVYKCMKFR